MKLLIKCPRTIESALPLFDNPISNGSHLMAHPLPPLSPEEVAKHEAAINECLERVKALLDSPDWKKDKEEKDVVFFTRKVQGSSFNMIKSISMIPVPMEKVLDELSEVRNLEPDMPASERDDTHQQHLFVAEPNRFNDGYMYLALESPSRLVSPRDFLMYRKHFEVDGKHFFPQVSIVNDAIRGPVKGFVRGNIITQCFVAEQAGDQVKLTFIVHADPAGSIPGWVYNQVATGQGYAVKKIRDKLIAQQ